MNLINEKVKHRRLGEGVIIGFEEQENYKSTVKIKFDNEDIRSFQLKTLCEEKYFDLDACSNDLIELSQEYKSKYKAEDNKIDVVAKKVFATKLYTKDEFDECVTLEKLYRAKSVAEVEREDYESRPVVSGDRELFINASAACRAYEVRPKDCDKIYKVCDRKAYTFAGVSWRYATKAEVQKYIDEYEQLEQEKEEI